MIAPASPDGRPISEVGPWARDKLTILEQYIKISRHARAKYTRRTEATYVDLFCGPGLSRIRGTDEYLPGSPVVAFDAAQESGVPFNRLFISDSDANNVDAARGRLEDKGAIVTAVAKAAEVAIDDVARQLNPHGLHFALLDPFNLFDLPFVIIEKLLTSFKHIDLMVLLKLAPAIFSEIFGRTTFRRAMPLSIDSHLGGARTCARTTLTTKLFGNASLTIGFRYSPRKTFHRPLRCIAPKIR